MSSTYLCRVSILPLGAGRTVPRAQPRPARRRAARGRPDRLQPCPLAALEANHQQAGGRADQLIESRLRRDEAGRRPPRTSASPRRRFGPILDGLMRDAPERGLHRACGREGVRQRSAARRAVQRLQPARRRRRRTRTTSSSLSRCTTSTSSIITGIPASKRPTYPSAESAHLATWRRTGVDATRQRPRRRAHDDGATLPPAAAAIDRARRGDQRLEPAR